MWCRCLDAVEKLFEANHKRLQQIQVRTYIQYLHTAIYGERCPLSYTGPHPAITGIRSHCTCSVERSLAAAGMCGGHTHWPVQPLLAAVSGGCGYGWS